MRCVAFLRGINVGGNKKVEMGKLKQMMESLGFSDVLTILNTGNIIFSADQTDADTVRSLIEQGIEKTFGFPVPAIIRSEKEIKDLIASDPFKGILVTDATRLYISFLKSPVKSTLPIPYTSDDGALKILNVTDSEIVSVVTVTDQKNTTDAMKMYEKEYGSPRSAAGEAGRDQTMRNWNTIQKIAEKL